MEFNRQTNRIINGICEYCGVKADACPHYAGQTKPLDYTESLAISPNAPAMPKVAIEPLTETEKAKSVEEYQAKTKEFKESQAGENLKKKSGKKPKSTA